ncbi:MAG: hypothetical protein ACYC2U_00715 [Candidatus Amoebophilus sp.]
MQHLSLSSTQSRDYDLTVILSNVYKKAVVVSIELAKIPLDK